MLRQNFGRTKKSIMIKSKMPFKHNPRINPTVHTVPMFSCDESTLTRNMTTVFFRFTQQLLLPCLVHMVRGIPLIAAPALYRCNCMASPITIGVISFFIIHCMLAFIAIVDTGAVEPGWWEKVSR